jgi:hypothetical protein
MEPQPGRTFGDHNSLVEFTDEAITDPAILATIRVNRVSASTLPGRVWWLLTVGLVLTALLGGVVLGWFLFAR